MTAQQFELPQRLRNITLIASSPKLKERHMNCFQAATSYRAPIRFLTKEKVFAPKCIKKQGTFKGTLL